MRFELRKLLEWSNSLNSRSAESYSHIFNSFLSTIFHPDSKNG